MHAVPRLSIIVPVLDEAPRIVAALKALAPLRAGGAEFVEHLILIHGASLTASPLRVDARSLKSRTKQTTNGAGQTISSVFVPIQNGSNSRKIVQ